MHRHGPLSFSASQQTLQTPDQSPEPGFAPAPIPDCMTAGERCRARVRSLRTGRKPSGERRRRGNQQAATTRARKSPIAALAWVEVTFCGVHLAESQLMPRTTPSNSNYGALAGLFTERESMDSDRRQDGQACIGGETCRRFRPPTRSARCQVRARHSDHHGLSFGLHAQCRDRLWRMAQARLARVGDGSCPGKSPNSGHRTDLCLARCSGQATMWSHAAITSGSGRSSEGTRGRRCPARPFCKKVTLWRVHPGQSHFMTRLKSVYRTSGIC